MTCSLRLLCISAVSTVAVFGHEVLTHQKIGDVAVLYLQQSAPSRPLLPTLQPLLWIGAVQEDTSALSYSLGGFVGNASRFFFHFTPSLTYAGGIFVNSSCNAVQWGLQDVACIATCNVPGICFGTGTALNQFRWSQDLTTDNAGVPNATAIKQFGYVVHLLEDMGAPSHTRNDLHPCPGGKVWCDPFEIDNNGSTPTIPPTGPAVIDTSAFSSPDQFFSSLQFYTSTNYYSYETAFSSPYIVAVDSDLRYFYGSCIQASFLSGTCETVNGLLVRKIAHKGPLYWAVCIGGPLGCDDRKAGIDTTIATEQFAELGPVIAQQVAGFIKFYAPALQLQLQGSAAGTVTSTQLVFPDGTSSPGTFNCASGACTALFVRGTQITLTATLSTSTVTWGGDCASAGNAPTVTLTLSGEKACTATFDSPIAVALNPFGAQSGAGPYYVDIVNGSLALTPAPQAITVTLLREVISQCSGPLFSSNRTVVVSQGQTSASYNFNAGHDPACFSLPITTRYTVTQAVLGASTVLDLSGVAAQQLVLSVFR